MANKIDLSLFETANRYEIGYRTDFTFDIDKLLDKLNMTPSVFAGIVGINVKKINKYRNGKIAKGADARLLYIINRDPTVIDYIYSFKHFYNGSEISKKTKQYIAIKQCKKHINEFIDKALERVDDNDPLAYVLTSGDMYKLNEILNKTIKKEEEEMKDNKTEIEMLDELLLANKKIKKLKKSRDKWKQIAQELNKGLDEAQAELEVYYKKENKNEI